MSDIKFEVRTRKSKALNFWSVFYDLESGEILSIVPGEHKTANALIVSYAKIKDLLSGRANQNNYRIKFVEELGAIDLVDYSSVQDMLRKKDWITWLGAREKEGDPVSSIRVLLFNDTGIVRIEADPAWTTALREEFNEDVIKNTIPLYISDEQDAHIVFGIINVKLADIVEKGYWENRLWAFMDHGLVQRILYQGQRIQVNIPPVTHSISFFRSNSYYAYSGITEHQTVISHLGVGKHISIYVDNGTIWAKSHYEKGSAIDLLVGNLKLAITSDVDPEYFYSWAELPALMLRQEHPFKVTDEWPYSTLPFVIYKANNLDIGVSFGNPN